MSFSELKKNYGHFCETCRFGDARVASVIGLDRGTYNLENVMLRRLLCTPMLQVEKLCD